MDDIPRLAVRRARLAGGRPRCPVQVGHRAGVIGCATSSRPARSLDRAAAALAPEDRERIRKHCMADLEVEVCDAAASRARRPVRRSAAARVPFGCNIFGLG
jgi:hypothetical protein